MKLTHDDYRRMLREVECDAVAVGDYFARRGEIVIAALEAGKHVIADKPICTKLELPGSCRSIRYPVTPTLSVEAFQVRLIWLELTAVAARLLGAVGGC